MLIQHRLRCVNIALAILGWGVLVASAIPLVPWEAGHHLTVLAALAAGVGSVAAVICSQDAPAVRVLEAGRAIGRAEALAECGVTDARGRRRGHLRLVDEG